MRGIVWTGELEVRDDVELREPTPGPGEVLVRIERAGAQLGATDFADHVIGRVQIVARGTFKLTRVGRGNNRRGARAARTGRSGGSRANFFSAAFAELGAGNIIVTTTGTFNHFGSCETPCKYLQGALIELLRQTFGFL